MRVQVAENIVCDDLITYYDWIHQRSLHVAVALYKRPILVKNSDTIPFLIVSGIALTQTFYFSVLFFTT